MLFAATWMQLEIIVLSEVSQTQKDKYHMLHLYMESKIDRNEFIYKTEINSQT